MSYNIDHVEYLKGKLMITRENLAAAREAVKEDKPETNFLDDALEQFDVAGGPDDAVEIENPWWNGECSGVFSDNFEKALSFTKGTADLIVTWEGGDSVNGLRVEDGKVTQKKVRRQLED